MVNRYVRFCLHSVHHNQLLTTQEIPD